MIFPKCVVCGRECIPLDDYDVPVCVKCDSDVEAVMLRARIGDLVLPEVAPVDEPDPATLFDDMRAWDLERKTA